MSRTALSWSVFNERQQADSVEGQKAFVSEQVARRASAAKVSAFTNDYSQLSINHKKLAKLNRDTESLRLEKGKIPSPFGSFELEPRVGLLAMALAALWTYILFDGRLRRISRLARAWKARSWKDRKPGDAISSWPPPFWLYPIGTTLSDALGNVSAKSRLKLAGGAILHGAWLALIAVTLLAAANWRSWEALAVPGMAPFSLALLVGATLAVLYLVGHRVLGGEGDAVETVSPGAAVWARRKFIAAIGGSILAIASAWYLLPRSQRGPRRATGVAVDEFATDQLVIHRVTGIAHHLEICRNHLPQGSNRVPYKSGPLRIHSRYAVRILEACAADASARGDHRLEEDLRLRATRVAPLSLHLYDTLVAKFGKARRYDRILSLLAEGAAKAAEATASPARPRVKRSIEAAARGFQQRAETAKLLASRPKRGSA